MNARLLAPALAGCMAAVLLAVTGPVHAQAPQERASPLDSVTVEVEGARIDVQYGRPSMRDREIFGGLVPWGEVWRTGANEATHLRTSADLEVAGTRVPAGHYTLYTIPTPDGWTLIVNEETGQWGTQYDEGRDLARIPMRVERLERPVETFTIAIDRGEEVAEAARGEADGALRMEWETTRAWVGFRVLEAAGG